MTPVIRWALVAGALVLAVIVAVLPRGGDTDAGPSADGSEELVAARARAGLRPCPAAPADDAGAGVLRAVPSVCLGDGERLDVGAALRGRTTLVNVWATWCAPCREELPVLDSYARSPEAVDVLGVQVASEARDGLALLAELGVHLPSLYDGAGSTGAVSTALRVPRSLPASFLVHPDGRVRFIENPRVFRDVEQVRKAVGTYGGTA